MGRRIISLRIFKDFRSSLALRCGLSPGGALRFGNPPWTRVGSDRWIYGRLGAFTALNVGHMPLCVQWGGAGVG